MIVLKRDIHSLFKLKKKAKTFHPKEFIFNYQEIAYSWGKVNFISTKKVT